MQMGRLCAAVAAVLALGPTAAQAAEPANPWAFELNGARSAKVNGAEFGLGYRFAAGNFRVTPEVGAFVYQGDNSRYVLSTFSNGQTHCRDTTNGQFATTELCDNTAIEAYGAVDATYRFTWGELGAGVRVSKGTTSPYASVSKSIGQDFAVRVKGGSDYVSLGIAYGF